MKYTFSNHTAINEYAINYSDYLKRQVKMEELTRSIHILMVSSLDLHILMVSSLDLHIC